MPNLEDQQQVCFFYLLDFVSLSLIQHQLLSFMAHCHSGPNPQGHAIHAINLEPSFDSERSHITCNLGLLQSLLAL